MESVPNQYVEEGGNKTAPGIDVVGEWGTIKGPTTAKTRERPTYTNPNAYKGCRLK